MQKRVKEGRALADPRYRQRRTPTKSEKLKRSKYKDNDFGLESPWRVRPEEYEVFEARKGRWWVICSGGIMTQTFGPFNSEEQALTFGRNYTGKVKEDR
jgi:nitrous oxide reductase accessory protein NosL